MPVSKQSNFLTSFRPCQYWTLPTFTIGYIAKNPSTAKVYQKLIQSCKYFFIKNHILVVQRLYLKKTDRVFFSSKQECMNFGDATFKIWIADEFDMALSVSNPPISSLIPKLYRVDVKKLLLYNQLISLNEFIFLASTAEEISLRRITVEDENELIVPLERLVSNCDKVRKFGIYNNSFPPLSSNTIKQLLELPNFSKINEFNFYYSSEIYDIETLFEHLKKNNSTKFKLEFDASISDEYKIRIEAIVDEIITTENHEYKVPMISYPGFDHVKWHKMFSLFSKL